MNRKLHNTTMALIASSSLFLLGLLGSSPAAPELAPSSGMATVASPAFDAEHAVAAEAVDETVEQVETSPRRHVRRARQQSVAMPFLSFAPRG